MSLTWRQAGQAVGGQRQLVEAAEETQVSGQLPQLVPVRRQVLERATAVEPRGQTGQTVSGHVQRLQLLEFPHL